VKQYTCHLRFWRIDGAGGSVDIMQTADSLALEQVVFGVRVKERARQAAEVLEALKQRLPKS
jgi:hypothetical protein